MTSASCLVADGDVSSRQESKELRQHTSVELAGRLKLLTSAPAAGVKTRSLSCSPWNSSKVSFGTVSVAEFPTIIGDSPSPSDGGCPVALSSRASRESNDIPLQAYEHQYRSSRGESLQQQRQRQRREGRNWSCCKLTNRQRKERLLQAGFSRDAIRRATEDAFQCRLQREHCNSQMSMDGVHSLLEKTSRSLRKILPVPYSFSSSSSYPHKNPSSTNSEVSRPQHSRRIRQPRTFTSRSA